LLIFLALVLFYYVSLRSEFRVVVSATISATTTKKKTTKKRGSVRFYLKLFVAGFMSYLRYLCVGA
jgi:hypothetical protein